MIANAAVTADIELGVINAVIEIAASPARVFDALASEEIVNWWVNPGVFDTREWAGDVRVGGRWRASGMSRGRPYVLEGEFLEVDPPHKLVHTWHLSGTPEDRMTTVSYTLEETDGGTRLALRHWGFKSNESCLANRVGWETSFHQLANLFSIAVKKENSHD
jgi:uncharacterized protein YndB with AHSA1/START domain